MGIRLPARLNRRYIFLSGIFILTIWLLLALDRPYDFPDHIDWNFYSTSLLSDSSTNEDIFDYPPVHSSAIRNVCATTTWNESLIFTCDDNTGGIGQVRNSILNCVRFSIAAGAGMVLPKISIRNESDISITHTGSSCPGLKLYSDLDDFEKINNAQDPIRLNPQALGVNFSNTGMEDPKKFAAALSKEGIEKPDKWGSMLHEWYTEIMEQYDLPGTLKGPIFIGLLRSYLAWPVLSDGKEFSTQFGKILKLRADARNLATKVVMNMAEKHKFGMDIHAPILENAFWGLHLRTESDSLEGLPAQSKDKLYPTYAMQAKLYFKYMEEQRESGMNTSLVYVASGDSSHVADFWKDAKVNNWTITTKVGLLKQKDLVELNSLTWDQQALVDLLVLARSSRFLGVGHSGFDWTVLRRRTVSLLNKNCTETAESGYKERIGESGDTLVSYLFGAQGEAKAYKTCLWP